jgi:hypothetical protein
MRYAFFGHSPDFGDFEARIVCLTGLGNSKSHQCEQKANSGSRQPRARETSRFSTPSREQCIRLSPRDNLIQFWYFRIGLVHLLQSRTAEAIPWLEKSAPRQPAISAISRVARLRLLPSKATPNALPPNSPKPAS